MEYVQIIRGGGWTYGGITCSNGMVLAKAAGNNKRLEDGHYITPWMGGVENLDRCNTCDAWFITPGMFQGHLNSVHAQGLK